VLRGHKGWVQCLAMSGTGKDRQQILASGGKDGLVKLWAPATGASLGELAGHAGPVTAVAFPFAKPRLLAVGTWSNDGKGEIKLWELVPEEKGTGYKGKEVRTLSGHKGGITCLAFSGDGNRLASGSADKTTIVWDVDSGKAVHTLACAAEVRCLAFSMDPTGSALATGSGAMIRVWTTSNGALVATPFTAHTDTVEALSFVSKSIPQAKVGGVLSAGTDSMLRWWALEEKTGFTPVATTRAAGHPMTCLYYNLAAGNVLTGGWDGTARMWDFDVSIRQADEEHAVPVIAIRERFTFAGHAGPVRAVVLSLDQSVLATAGHDGTIRLWRATPRRAKAKEDK
jgi:WD40 repeat protein